jgi:ADP-ribose pyrophosphatase YjhB (NUDIX family)
MEKTISGGFLSNLIREPFDPAGMLTPVFANEFVSLKTSVDGEHVEVTVGTGRGAAVLVRSSNKILMIRTPRYATGRMEWALPRGGSMKDELALETAMRCVEGWTGVTVDPESAIHLGDMNPDPEVLTNSVELFVVEARSSKVRANHEDSKWVAIEELVAACVEGEIEDSFTCMAVLRARINGIV